MSTIPMAAWTQVPRPEAASMMPLHLPPPVSEQMSGPEAYVPDDGLVSAANVSLLLGQPLLITGEPGSGKTAFATWFADQLGLGRPLVEVVKSTTTGRDLLYDFDALARFRDVQLSIAKAAKDETPTRDESNQPGEDLRYVRFRSLGAAIASSSPNLPRELGDKVAEVTRRNQPTPQAPSRHLVLVDELDKAPRDTPNDLLHEIERMEFTITELAATIRGRPDCRPIVVITSNSERSLPDPFLRRCVYYNIPDLEGEDGRKRLDRIVKSRIASLRQRDQGELASRIEELQPRIVERFFDLRSAFGRKPGVAEFLGLVCALAQQSLLTPRGAKGSSLDELWRLGVAVIAKTREDREAAGRMLKTSS